MVGAESLMVATVYVFVRRTASVRLAAIQPAAVASRGRRQRGDGGGVEREKKTIKEIPSY